MRLKIALGGTCKNKEEKDQPSHPSTSKNPRKRHAMKEGTVPTLLQERDLYTKNKESIRGKETTMTTLISTLKLFELIRKYKLLSTKGTIHNLVPT